MARFWESTTNPLVIHGGMPRALRGSMTDAQKLLADRFHTLETMLADMRTTLMRPPSEPPPGRPDTPEERVAIARRLLAERGSLTAAEVQIELGVSHTTAMRTIHAVARDKGGIMVLEPTGPTFRVRLWHPDRVILDHEGN